jgi:hypothetical protein
MILVDNINFSNVLNLFNNRLSILGLLMDTAWRIGNSDGDVIMHSPQPNMPPQPGGVAYHVWLEIGKHLLDFTTYQLRDKAAHMDELDGGTTTVLWCPDFLFVPKTSVSPLHSVIQLRAGLYHYVRVPVVEARIIATAPQFDEDDIDTAWLLYQNPALKVFGPNNMLKGKLHR